MIVALFLGVWLVVAVVVSWLVAGVIRLRELYG